MNDSTIAQLNAATSLTGQEFLPVMQNGTTLRTTAAQIAALASAGSQGPTGPQGPQGPAGPSGGSNPYATVAVTNGSVTLNTTQATADHLDVTGTLTNDVTLVYPTGTQGNKTIANKTTDHNTNPNVSIGYQTSFNVFASMTGGTNTQAILPGTARLFYLDGTNVNGVTSMSMGTLSFADWIGTSYVTIKDMTTQIQNFLLYCQLVALTLKAHVLDDQMQRLFVTAYFPRGTYSVSCPIIVPSLVCIDMDGTFFRNGTSTTATKTAFYTGDTTTNALVNLIQPTLILAPNAHADKINLYCNPDNTNKGSGLAIGKNWNIASVAIGAGGTGYVVGDYLYASCPLPQPFFGFNCHVTSIGAGGTITGVAMNSSGCYDLPPILQKQQYTTANGYGGVFDSSGNYTTYTNSTSGAGATLTPTWASDFQNGQYVGGQGAIIGDTTINHVNIIAAGQQNDSTYGPCFGTFIWGLNYTIGEIESGGGYYGIWCDFVSDLRFTKFNPVNSVYQLVIYGGNSICGTLTADTNYAGSFALIDNTTTIDLTVQTVNFGTAVGTHGIKIGSRSSAGNRVSGLRLSLVGFDAGTATGVPLVYMDYADNVSAEFLQVNHNYDNSLLPYPTTSLVEFGAHNGNNITIRGASDTTATTPLFIGTPPVFGAHVWDGSVKGFAKPGGTYELYGSGAPTSGTSGTGVSKAGKGSLYTDFTNGIVYVNGGPASSPSWTALGTSTLSNPPIPSSTFASLPSAAGNTGKYYLVTDIGTGGSIWYSNGTIWKPQSGILNLYSLTTQSNTAGNTGNFTLGAFTLPAGMLGLGGALRIAANYHASTTAARSVGFRIDFGASGGTMLNTSATVNGAITQSASITLNNNGSTSSQNYSGISCNSVNGAASIPQGALTQATASAVTITIYGNAANAADLVYLDNVTIDLVMN